MRAPLLLALLTLQARACAAQAAPLLPITLSPTATACNGGQTARPCILMEVVSGWGNRTNCPCPYLDGGGGGPGPVKYFSMAISHLIRPSRIANFSKTHVVFNGQIPGPTIDVTEGDWVEVSVTNAMDDVPTTVHFHGILNVMTPFNDGVPSMTQCAIQPGATLVYTFRASNAGTYWYHGHVLEQYVDGLFGPLIVRPAAGTPQAMPATDSEVVLMLQDYYNNGAHALVTGFYLTPPSIGIEPIPDAIAVNGLFSQQLFIAVPSRTSKTLFRVISAAGLSMYTVSIDGVNLEVVEVDSTAVAPFMRPYVVVNAAQRLSFIVDWSTLPAALNSTPAVFMRIIADQSMYAVQLEGYIPPYEAPLTGAEQLNPNFYGVVQFSPLSAGNLVPNYTVADTADDDQTPQGNWALPISFAGTPYAGIVNLSSLALEDSNMLDARPVLPLVMPSLTHQLFVALTFAFDAAGIDRGQFNGITHTHNFEGGLMPELFARSVYGTPQGGGVVDDPSIYSNQANVPSELSGMFGPLPALAVPFSDEAHYHLPAGGVIGMVINSNDNADHPFHLHGHTFWVIATSERPDAEKLYAANYARRDTVTIPANGWVKIGFVADNPGIWAAHCHIEWHVATGMMMEMFEGLAALNGLPVPLGHQRNCNLPPPGTATFVQPNPYLDTSASVIVGGEPLFVGSQPFVQTSNCFAGQAHRTCTLIERATTGWHNATSCKCPYVDGVTGGAGPVKRFIWSVAHVVTSLPLDPAINKVLYAINGKVPGPTLVVDEGDWVEVTITNNMDEEDTMFNWLGFSQTFTPYNDGIETVTQCSLQPGNTIVYGLRMGSAGTYFYRGSINQQDIDGLKGAIIVRAPAGSPEALPTFDSEAVLTVGDRYSNNAHSLVNDYYLTPLSGGLAPIPDAIVVNGKYTAAALPSGYSASSLCFVSVVPFALLPDGQMGTAATTLLHLVAATAMTSFNFSIDGVNLRIVELDTTPVVPFVVPWLTLATGQRASVLVVWSQLPQALVGTSVFFRVTALPSSYGGVNLSSYVPPYEHANANARPLVSAFVGVLVFGTLEADGTGAMPPYANSTVLSAPVAAAVSNAGTPYAGLAPLQANANMIDARPAIPVPMPNAGTHLLYAKIDFMNDALGVNRARINGISHAVDPTGGIIPSLYTHMIYGTAAGGAVPIDPADYPFVAAPASGQSFGAALPALAVNFSSQAHYLVPSGAVLVIVLDNAANAHRIPIHIHGNVFWILATSDRPDAEAAYAGNYLRRDIVLLPPGGWAKIAFVADNPGMWALECANTWHSTAGLMLELLAAMPALAGLPVPPSHRAACGLAVPSATPSPVPFSSVTLAPAAAASASATPGSAAVPAIVAVQGIPTWAFGDARIIALLGSSIAAALAPSAAAFGATLSVRVKLLADIASGAVIYSEARRRTQGESAAVTNGTVTAGVEVKFVALTLQAAAAAVAAAIAAPAFGPAVLAAAAAGVTVAAPELVLEPYFMSVDASVALYMPPAVAVGAMPTASLTSQLGSLVVPLAAGFGSVIVLLGALYARYAQLRRGVWRKGIVVPSEPETPAARRASEAVTMRLAARRESQGVFVAAGTRQF